MTEQTPDTGTTDTAATQFPFGFRVQRADDNSDLWMVYLPHQCDEWVIAGDDQGYSPTPVEHSVAVTELERFIMEASQALTALRESREFSADD